MVAADEEQFLFDYLKAIFRLFKLSENGLSGAASDALK